MSQLKGKPPINNPAQESVNKITATADNTAGPKTHKFGPLVWRTSRERRKAKQQRHNKCNSGDSGIQVELEADDNQPEIARLGEDLRPLNETINPNVRRTNSAKASKPTGRLENVEREGGHYSLDRRSLSQPTDLNRLPETIDSESDTSEGE